jgi:peptide/nickel transport system substrate-binding protein
MAWVGTRGRLWLLIGGAAVLCLLALFGRGAESRGAIVSPNTLQVSFSSFPDYMDPQLSYTFEGWTAMYETYIPLLTYQRANGQAGAEIIPGLAAGLPQISNGGRTYTLFLRQGLKYSDGSLVRASDFEYAVKRMLQVYSGGFPFYMVIAGAQEYLRNGRGDISGIVANNHSGRIVIHLLRPMSTFTQLLAVPFAAPVPANTPMRDQSFSPPPATGPYAFGAVDIDHWTYERNPSWTTNGALMPQLPSGHADKIDVSVIRDPEAAVRAVVGGAVDYMQNEPRVSRFAELRRKFLGTQLRLVSTLSTYYFWMNTRRAPFNDRRVREAANYAVDRSVLARIYAGRVAPTQQILPPGMPGFRRFELYSYDLAKARRLVAKADPEDRRVTVWTDTESPHEEAAEYYRSQLEKIGLRPRLKVVNADRYFTVIGNWRTANLDTGWSDWFADYAHPDDFFRPLLLGSSILRTNNGNFAKASIPALDAKIERLSQRTLGPGRERAYAALDRAFMKRAPWVPYGNRALSLFVSKRVDIDKVVWSPLFGADLASFGFE